MKYKLYIEGGGDSDRQAAQFRASWAAFFEKAGLANRKPAVVRGGGRTKTFDRFKTAVANAKEDEVPLLLVDSEDPLQPGDTVWQHLKKRDKWDKPVGADENQAFLMVQVMETWFVADRKSLELFFGPGFNEEKIPAWPALESVPKAQVLDALERATAGCKAPYEKGKRSFDLLGKVDPNRIASACPHANALLNKLRA